MRGIVIIIAASANSPYHNANCAGNREALVHLFEWKWSDIAAECERFLGRPGAIRICAVG